MKLVEKKSDDVLLLLTQREIQLITSALGEISNILDVEDCETRTGYNLDNFERLFYEFNVIDDR
ncbi:hypothetical protein B0186_11140 [Canicola haemoglobinophilus]|uniref:Uncharacterized protein n=1 Tax=Canicola haemoglobinophilus TaxID=733 RepID=A0A1V4AYD0_9PAST|nr:hypothetical protein [Canicola haemoglobinophilus]OOR96478.1 hypothetical protein B0186_11140 [Canicola haemoglobinophilus]STO59250.1 Uncharacterised protein [Canicola haemoglobinophilus]